MSRNFMITHGHRGAWSKCSMLKRYSKASKVQHPSQQRRVGQHASSHLSEDRVYGHLLLEETAREVNLGADVTAVHLDLADVSSLLPQLHQAHLRKRTERSSVTVMGTARCTTL